MKLEDWRFGMRKLRRAMVEFGEWDSGVVRKAIG